MSSLRTAGGILAIIGGGFILVDTMLTLEALISGSMSMADKYSFLEAIVIGILALIGGIIVLRGNASGGTLILITGITAVMLGLLGYLACGTGICPYIHISEFSFVAWLMGIAPFSNTFFFVLGVTFEAILIAIGGILSRKE